MIEKLSEALRLLDQTFGWKCRMEYSSSGWACRVLYIDEGPEFDYLVTIDPWVLSQGAVTIAGYVYAQALDAVEVRDGEEQ